MSKQRIAVLTGGGDCPGLNAALRAVTKTSVLKYGWEVWGSEDSFGGLLGQGRMIRMTPETVRGILPKGGTLLGTSNQEDPFSFPVADENGAVEFRDYSQKLVGNFLDRKLDGLIAIGGDGTLALAWKFQQLGVPVVGVPKTIDNDLLSTEVTFGFDTALQTVTEAIDKLHSTAESHDRVMVIEVMGRNAGWIALRAGMAGGADVVLIPEIPYRIDRICEKVAQRAASGRRFSILVVAEGATPIGGQQVYRHGSREASHGRLGGISYQVAAEIKECLDLEIEARVVVLGHLQRGGSPSPFDRVLATRFGCAAVELVAQENFGRMVSLRCGEIVPVPIQEAIRQERRIDVESEEIGAARAIGIVFGD